MQLVGLAVSVLPEDLDVVEHGLDDILGLLEFPLDLVAVGLCVLRAEIWSFLYDQNLFSI